MKLEKEYLSVLFRGGPANRFFEYHTATYLAKIWNKEFVVDPSNVSSFGMHHDPGFDISNFFECKTVMVPKYHLKIRQFNKEGRINPHWKDDLIKMDAPVGSVLLTDGWYQTFWDNHFTIPKLPVSKVTFDASSAVFIHVRRGDYINSRIYVDLVNYYKRAYERIEQLFSNSTFVICSDDIGWCKNNLKYVENSCFLENTDYQKTLWLMSQCKRGAILSNSTYGLWGAYLARIRNNFDPSFKVLIPSQWVKETDIRNFGIGKYIYPSWSERVEV